MMMIVITKKETEVNVEKQIYYNLSILSQFEGINDNDSNYKKEPEVNVEKQIYYNLSIIVEIFIIIIITIIER